MRSRFPQLFWIAIFALGAAGAASARTETIRWSQSRPGLIAGFEIRWGTTPGNYPNVIDVGLPAPNSDGVYSRLVNLPEESVYLVARSKDLAGYFSAFSAPKYLGIDGGSSAGDVFENFEGLALGDAIPGWFDTQQKNSLQQDDSLFSVMDLGGNRVIGTASEALNIHSHFIGMGDRANYEFSGRMRIQESGGSAGVTAYSAFPDADVYYKLFRIGAGPDYDFWIVGHPDISCDSAHTGVTPVAGAWYRFRLEVSSSSTANQIRARVWRDGGSEPPVWQATCIDASSGRPASGTIGLWSRGPGEKYWDDLSVVSVPPYPDEAGGGGAGNSELGAPGRPVVILP